MGEGLLPTNESTETIVFTDRQGERVEKFKIVIL